MGYFMGGLSAGIMEMAAWTRGFANYFSDFANNENLLVALMRKVMELKMAYWEMALARSGRLCGRGQRGRRLRRSVPHVDLASHVPPDR